LRSVLRLRPQPLHAAPTSPAGGKALAACHRFDSTWPRTLATPGGRPETAGDGERIEPERRSRSVAAVTFRSFPPSCLPTRGVRKVCHCASTGLLRRRSLSSLGSPRPREIMRALVVCVSRALSSAGITPAAGRGYGGRVRFSASSRSRTRLLHRRAPTDTWRGDKLARGSVGRAP
jgi:hypothetical protein